MNLDPQATPNSEKKSILKNPLVYSSIVLLVVAGYVSYVLLSRYESNRQYVERNTEKQAEQRREDDRRAVEQLGGSDLAIRSMYVAPAAIKRGESAQLCYDVANAKTVTLHLFSRGTSSTLVDAQGRPVPANTPPAAISR